MGSTETVRGALAFYADPAHWVADGAIQTPGQHPLVESPVGFDGGARARAALVIGDATVRTLSAALRDIVAIGVGTTSAREDALEMQRLARKVLTSGDALLTMEDTP